MFLILSPSRVNWIVVAQTPLVLKVSSIRVSGLKVRVKYRMLTAPL